MARRSGDDLAVAILGLGEAGTRLAADLVERGVAVAGWDPAVAPDIAGVRLAEGPPDAARGSDVVLSLNSSRAALDAVRACASAIDGVLYADLNTAAPSLKVEVAAAAAGSGALFADVALLAPVPRRGLGTPSLASGSGAQAFADVFRPLGMPVEVLGADPGLASQRKLLRSVFMKGLAASIVESLEGAAAAGCEEWLRGQIAATLESADAAFVDRLVDGSRLHAARRVDEMDAACELLRDLGVEPRVATAAAAQLAELARSEHGATAR